MKITSPAKLLFPVEHRESLSMALQKRVPYLVNADLVMFLFFVGASTVRFLSHPEAFRAFFLAVQATSIVAYPLSLTLVRKKRYRAASWVGSGATLLNVCWLSFLLPVSGENDLYRFGMYTVVAVISNSLVALDIRQVILFGFATGLAFFGYSLGLLLPRFGIGDEEFRSLGLTVFAVLFLTDVFVYYVSRISQDLIDLAARDALASKGKADRLRDLISGSRGSLRIGEQLGAKAEESVREAGEVKARMAALEERARVLASDAREAGEANAQVASFTAAMRDSVVGQNEVIHETSAALAQTAATISSLAKVASARKSGIDALVAGLQSQASEMRKVVEGMDRIRESSEKVLGSAGLILDVSEKTDLLAMNASIEAAHAGQAGKGFAVISQEIRKLSEEARRGTSEISEALKENDTVIKGATELVHSFQRAFEGSSDAMRETFEAMEEIIRGLSEMEDANEGLRAATTRMTDIARKTEEGVGDVAGRVEAATAGTARISGFAENLLADIESMREHFSTIEASMNAIGDIGKANVGHIAELGRSLHEINRSD